ncbi:hypothetical protein ACJWU5_26580, partial [Klebsiella pneumoniae]
TVCVVGKMRDLILQLSKSSIYSTKPIDTSVTGESIFARQVTRTENRDAYCPEVGPDADHQSHPDH